MSNCTHHAGVALAIAWLCVPLLGAAGLAWLIASEIRYDRRLRADAAARRR
jgi:hypothetical protein